MGARLHMTTTTKIVKHALHFRRQLRYQLVAVVAGAATRVIHKVMMALCTGPGTVIEMFEGNRQLGALNYCRLSPVNSAIAEYQ